MTTKDLINSLQSDDNCDLVAVRIGGAVRIAKLPACQSLSWPDIYTILNTATERAKELAGGADAQREGSKNLQ